MFTLSPESLQQAGFTLENDLPSGTRYEAGHLYMRLAASGTIRVFVPHNSNQVEVSSGSIYDPHVHYTGPIHNVDELLRFVDGYVL